MPRAIILTQHTPTHRSHIVIREGGFDRVDSPFEATRYDSFVAAEVGWNHAFGMGLTHIYLHEIQVPKMVPCHCQTLKRAPRAGQFPCALCRGANEITPRRHRLHVVARREVIQRFRRRHLGYSYLYNFRSGV